MTQSDMKLSAFLDGELSEDEASRIEAALANDPALQAELEALMAADAVAQDEFAAMLEEPVPLALAAAIHDAPTAPAANAPAAPSIRGWLLAATAALALLIGGTGGYFAGATRDTQVAATPGWLDDIADYHRVYAGQTRHLVEVGADDAEHIQTWLTSTVGAPVRIPDLSEHGLTFEGGRLLVAAGKPVAQLMFTDAEDRVVALCLIRSDAPREGTGRLIVDDFEMVTWGGTDANFVLVGDAGRSDLDAIAETAAQRT